MKVKELMRELAKLTPSMEVTVSTHLPNSIPVTLRRVETQEYAASKRRFVVLGDVLSSSGRVPDRDVRF
ncbi:MAG: hypothetical protein MN733_16925 [Nitrososphaera sp.]|nr:hypothetical protein [Nitrososphaera sp.]